jgi:phosphoenolpyruvate carboxylase
MQFCEHRYGRDAIGSYVVSRARDVDDVLSVLLLAQWAGLADGPDGALEVDVAPLFESVESLEDAGAIVTRLLADRVYRAHLAARGNRQVVMIGYSGSNKSVGIAASRWLLRQAQAAMVEACNAAGVELLVFHGRGGPISVGGGRTDTLLRSAPPGAVRGPLRVTEHGESISERYGLRPIALRSFERSLNALAIATAAQPGSAAVDPRWHEALALLADESRRAYRAQVHDDPAFLEFFQSVTPVDVIERMQIGSRPLARGSGGGVDAIRAVPWAFAWSQSRHMLPGWFGAGTGLAAVVERFGSDVIHEMHKDWPFFAGLIDGVEMQLARADMDIAERYERLYKGEVGPYSAAIRAEYDLTRAIVLQLKGSARLLDSEPTMQRSIWLRNPYVDPIHLTQIELLSRWREAGSPSDKGRPAEDAARYLFPALVASVNGIAHGLQGTG